MSTDPGSRSDASMTAEILGRMSVSQLAARLGTDEATAAEAAEAALPTLLAGMTSQAQDPARRARLAAALEADHDEGVLDDEDPLSRVDAEEGRKIVAHTFGDRTAQVESDVQGFLGGEAGMAEKVMPLLAPLVMSYLKKKMLGGGQAAPSGGGGLGDILGSVLGGRQPAPAPSGGGGLGDILGGILGGGPAGGGAAPAQPEAPGGGGLGGLLEQLGGKAGKGGGLDDLLGSILAGR